MQVAQHTAASTASRPGGKDFAGHLSEWARSGGRLPARSAGALAPEVCLLPHAPSARWPPPQPSLPLCGAVLDSPRPSHLGQGRPWIRPYWWHPTTAARLTSHAACTPCTAAKLCPAGGNTGCRACSHRRAGATGAQVERLLREGRDVRRRPQFWGHRAACHVLLAADRRLADQLQRARAPPCFRTAPPPWPPAIALLHHPSAWGSLLQHR